jgi:hypothetical protein
MGDAPLLIVAVQYFSEGSYRLSVFDQPQKVLTVRLRPGTNVLPDWDLVARS